MTCQAIPPRQAAALAAGVACAQVSLTRLAEAASRSSVHSSKESVGLRLPPEQPSDDGSTRAFVSQSHEQGTDAHTYEEAGMLAMLGMLFAVGGILWIILVVILVLLILGFVFNRR